MLSEGKKVITKNIIFGINNAISLAFSTHPKKNHVIAGSTNTPNNTKTANEKPS
jgi:hypothetical protein